MGCIDGTLFVVGGYTFGGQPSAATWTYDIDDGSWDEQTPAPVNVLGAARNQPVVDGTLYLSHELNWDDQPTPHKAPSKAAPVEGGRTRVFYATCFAYSPAAESTPAASPWRRLADGVNPRDGVACGVVDDRLYVVGGRDTERPAPKGVRHVEAFGPPMKS